MGLTAPSFLFIFLPLSLPFLFLLPRKHRWRIPFLSLFSFFLYVLSNRQNPVGLLHVGLLLFFVVWLAYLPPAHSVGAAKVRTALGVAVPAASFLAARLLSEYGTGYTYPVGLMFLTLGAISYAVDTARGDTVRPRNPLELIGYLLFFPCLLVGPVLRSKEYFDLTEELSFKSPLFARGAMLYMIGYIKRLAVFAVLMRALEDVLLYLSQNECALSTFLLMLVLSYFAFHFFITGTADMARGVCGMYGIEAPRDRSNLALAHTPERMMFGTLGSWRVWFYDYVQSPISHRLRGKCKKPICTLLFYVFFVLLLRTRPELLLFGLPILLFALFANTAPLQRVRACRPWLRPLCSLASVFLCSFFTLALMLDRPLALFDFLGQALGGARNRLPSHVFATMRDERYLLVLLIVAALIYPYALLRRRLLRRAAPRRAVFLLSAETVLIFAAFFLSLIYFLPQFPGGL